MFDFSEATPATDSCDSTEACAAPPEGAPHGPSKDRRPSERPIGETPPLPSPRADARAARIEKFRREQVIVDFLNRGVSVAEIAAKVGVGEKRMRAIIREILARRMPAPPEEFVAIQVSRLNEALLVAYTAMTDMNLKAVDRVVKIVRELDRYHGFSAATRRVPEAPRLEEPAEEVMAFGAALVCSAKFAPQDVDHIEPISPLPLSPRQRGEGRPPDWIRGEGLGRLAAVDTHPAPCNSKAWYRLGVPEGTPCPGRPPGAGCRRSDR